MINGGMVFTSDCLENITKVNQSPGKLVFTDSPHGILFFLGKPGISHPLLCMDIKWNSPMYFKSFAVNKLKLLNRGL